LEKQSSETKKGKVPKKKKGKKDPESQRGTHKGPRGNRSREPEKTNTTKD